jgi:hypothetical protein
MFFCGSEQSLVVCKGFDRGFGDEDVDLSFDGVQSDGVVCCVWSEDCDGVAGEEGIDCFLVGFGIAGVIWRVGVEGDIEIIVDLGDVFVEMLSYEARSVGEGSGWEKEGHTNCGVFGP